MEVMQTSFGNAESEFDYDSAEIAAESGLVGAIDGNDGGIAWFLPMVDEDDVVPRNTHLRATLVSYILPLFFQQKRAGKTFPPSYSGLKSLGQGSIPRVACTTHIYIQR